MLCLLFLMLGNLGSAQADNKARLRVGFILPLSGQWSFLGEGIRDGALLAKADLAEDGFPVELIFEDSRGDLAASATAATRLLTDSKVDALVSIISGVARVLKPMAEAARVIHVGICSDTEVADGRYNFVNYLTAEQGATKYVDYFTTAVGRGKSVGIYAMNEAGFQKIVDAVSARAKDAMQVRFIEHFDRGISDFKPVLLRNRAHKPDVLLILGLSPEIELIARQARSIGIESHLTSIEGFGLSSDRSAFEGAWFVDSAIPNHTFRERFQRRYGRELTPGVGHSYDSVLLLARAFGHQRSSTPIERAVAVQNFRGASEFVGVTGKLGVRSDGIVWTEASVQTIVNGESVLAIP